MDSNYIQRGNTLRRGRTLVRPDRQQGPAPMLDGSKERKPLDPWVIFSKIVTFWAPGFILKHTGFPAKDMQQAWREKVTLCFLICLICAAVVFLTLFLPKVLCTAEDQANVNLAYSVKHANGQETIGLWNVFGKLYSGSTAKYPLGWFTNSGDTVVPDISPYMKRPQGTIEKCKALNSNFNIINELPCGNDDDQSGCRFLYGSDAYMAQEYELYNRVPEGPLGAKAGFDWEDINDDKIVIEGFVLNLKLYFQKIEYQPRDLLDDALLRAAKSKADATKLFTRNVDFIKVKQCLIDLYKSGELVKSTPGCFVTQIFQYVALIVILGIVLIRFIMAFVFHWFISANLSRRPKNNYKKPAIPKQQYAVGGASKQISDDPNELFGIMLVTCYSESEASMRCTLDSLANTDYSDDKKLLFIVADGIITGSGNDKSTPDICISMMEMDPAFENPEPQSYIAVAAGSKQHNMAQVYCGYYNYKEHRVPTLLVVKSGGPDEQGKPKPGNRGKRDSQLILMNFFSRVIYNERMTPLDYDMFRKIQHLMGVTPDYFETVLMVDADTKVYPDSLKLLTYCLINDPLIMGLCGETKIANKRQSWVTGIQVFEYYISHHMGKGFESVFGGVTCLPGCFCMYRLKAPKGDSDWVPIITKPEIVQEYSQNVVETLHQKNLLLLGEDRFLTTLMLRNFPNRKMVFCPQAVCKTIVPDEFSVLLSQRRRWINSTIHNLMELILVRNLCGTFCFSMQFVIFMELIGTVVLPVAIVMTFVLIVTMAQGTISSFAGALPLIMLVMVLFSPAILIFITTRKLIYIAWMVVYLIALPIWNFVLPVYSYWHFDDFSWGATRQVEGEAKGDSHGKSEGEFDSSKVSLRRWEDYERRRRRDIRRKEREANMGHNRYESGDKLMYAQNPHEYDMSYYDNQSVVSDGPGIGPEQHIYQYGSGSRHSSTYNTPVNFPVPSHNAYSDSRTPSTERHRDSTTMGSPYSYNRNQPRGPRPMQ